jgi:glyceraldehyde 3-phosphate dehydrogenase
MKRIKVGLNGFGRIGRAFTRIAMMRDSFDLVAINTRHADPVMSAYLLQHDSVYRLYGKHVSSKEGAIIVDGKEIKMLENADPTAIPWGDLGVDVVVDATGAFTKKPDLEAHIKAGAKKVILTAPSKDDETPHVVLGVNDANFDFPSCSVISNCSCTTNCASPMFKVVHDKFKVLSGFLTTVHAYTQTQSLQDDALKDFERSRSAPLNIVPSTTGAAKAVVKTIPELEGKIDGMAMRVPVPVGSFTDISMVVEKATTVEEVNAAFKEASEGSMKGFLGYETEVLVSTDYIGNPNSCTFDANYTKVINGNLVTVFGWYDNEWGYTCRVVDLVERVSDFV